jgi:hypothetical protein
MSEPPINRHLVEALERALADARKGEVQALCLITVGPKPGYAHDHQMFFSDDVTICGLHFYGVLVEAQHELLHRSRQPGDMPDDAHRVAHAVADAFPPNWARPRAATPADMDLRALARKAIETSRRRTAEKRAITAEEHSRRSEASAKGWKTRKANRAKRRRKPSDGSKIVGYRDGKPIYQIRQIRRRKGT